MTTDTHDPSHFDDRPSFVSWIPLLVPLSAVVFAALIFVIAAEVLVRP